MREECLSRTMKPVSRMRWQQTTADGNNSWMKVIFPRKKILQRHNKDIVQPLQQYHPFHFKRSLKKDSQKLEFACHNRGTTEVQAWILLCVKLPYVHVFNIINTDDDGSPRVSSHAKDCIWNLQHTNSKLNHLVLHVAASHTLRIQREHKMDKKLRITMLLRLGLP